MAKGDEISINEEILGEILWMYMYNEDAPIRTAAKEAFTKHAPAEAKKIVRDNWRVRYRKQDHGTVFNDIRLDKIKKFKSCNVGDCSNKYGDGEDIAGNVSQAKQPLAARRVV